jgi:hypothetical protein
MGQYFYLFFGQRVWNTTRIASFSCALRAKLGVVQKTLSDCFESIAGLFLIVKAFLIKMLALGAVFYRDCVSNDYCYLNSPPEIPYPSINYHLDNNYERTFVVLLSQKETLSDRHRLTLHKFR